jgi:hypothetical protein
MQFASNKKPPWLSILVVCATLFGGEFSFSCASGGHMEQKDQETAKSPVLLVVDAKVQDQTVRLQYRVRNTRDKPIYLFNVLWDWDEKGDYVVPPIPVYACLKQESMLHLAKQILPLPHNREVEVRMVPFATKVEVGQEFSATFQLALPVQEYNPYFPPDGKSAYQTMIADVMVFSLHFVNELDGLKTQSAPLPGAFLLQHPKLLSQIETLRSDALRVQVPVQKRLDEFEEF